MDDDYLTNWNQDDYDEGFEAILFHNWTQNESVAAELRELRAAETDFSAYVAGFAHEVGDSPELRNKWTS